MANFREQAQARIEAAKQQEAEREAQENIDAQEAQQPIKEDPFLPAEDAQETELHKHMLEDIQDSYSGDFMQDFKKMAEDFSTIFEAVSNAIKDFSQSEQGQAIKLFLQALFENKNILFTASDAQELKELESYLDEEIQKPEYGGHDLTTLWLTAERDAAGNLLPDSLMAKALAAARLQKLAADIPKLQSKGIPKFYRSPNTPITNALLANDGKGELIGAGAVDIPIANIGKPNEVTIYTIAELRNTEGIILKGKPFTEYDQAVHDAAGSLLEYMKDNHLDPYITAEMIYRTMTHKTNTEKVSEAEVAAVEASMEKQRNNIHVYADLTAEMKLRGIKDENGETVKHIMDGFLFSATRHTVIAGGKKTTAYYILDDPILFKYARMTNQIISIKGEMLNIKELDSTGAITNNSIPNTAGRISVKNALFHRIEVMRNDEKRAAEALRVYERRRAKDKTGTLEPRTISYYMKQRHVILFETLLNAAGIPQRSRAKMKDYVYQVLDFWKAHGDIKGYSKRKKGKGIDAVVIEF